MNMTSRSHQDLVIDQFGPNAAAYVTSQVHAHGEDLQQLDGETGHGAPAYTQHAFEIPAFVWVNDAYRGAHPQVVAALKSNTNKEIRSHNVFYTVADLMGIEWPGAKPERSFASDRFLPDASMKLVAGGLLVMPPGHSEADAGSHAVIAAADAH